MPHKHHGAGHGGVGGDYEYDERDGERELQIEAGRDSYRDRENERYGLRPQNHAQTGPGQQTFQFEDGRTSPGESSSSIYIVWRRKKANIDLFFILTCVCVRFRCRYRCLPPQAQEDHDRVQLLLLSVSLL